MDYLETMKNEIFVGHALAKWLLKLPCVISQDGVTIIPNYYTLPECLAIKTGVGNTTTVLKNLERDFLNFILKNDPKTSSLLCLV